MISTKTESLLVKTSKSFASYAFLHHENCYIVLGVADTLGGVGNLGTPHVIKLELKILLFYYLYYYLLLLLEKKTNSSHSIDKENI